SGMFSMPDVLATIPARSPASRYFVVALDMAAVVLPTALPDHIRNQWPYTPRFASVNGWRMHYVDEGAGDPVVLLHGNPTWGVLYRDVIPPLVAAGHRLI